MSGRLPPWIRTRIPSGKRFAHVSTILDGGDLRTVCREAKCPNRAECWGAGTATFMVLGDVCTRACRFCGVRHASPSLGPAAPDPGEPDRIARAVRRLDLKHVVVTSVTRDDLEDGGAGHIARVIDALSGDTGVRIEALIPDILPPHLSKIAQRPLFILAHNIEVVRRLTPLVRDGRADYDKSLRVLREAKRIRSDLLTKSSLMLGLGESGEEVDEAMEDLRGCGVDLLTLGQYLQPGRSNIPVSEYLAPEAWEELGAKGEAMGFRAVLAGPMVRSSYLAGELV
ncbi:MAG: lipoyl synthase [Pseudomonadota bacterium]